MPVGPFVLLTFKISDIAIVQNVENCILCTTQDHSADGHKPLGTSEEANISITEQQ